MHDIVFEDNLARALVKKVRETFCALQNHPHCNHHDHARKDRDVIVVFQHAVTPSGISVKGKLAVSDAKHAGAVLRPRLQLVEDSRPSHSSGLSAQQGKNVAATGNLHVEQKRSSQIAKGKVNLPLECAAQYCEMKHNLAAAPFS
ncbi:MAG: hypothetical protein AAFV19_08220 [Pseudomonadota bacterium]